MYTKEAFLQDCRDVFDRTEGNTAQIPGIGDVVLYEMPLIGFAAADDPLFEEYRRPEIVGPRYFTPGQWLDSARTVVSFFFPFTEKVRLSNRADKVEPSAEWLYGRVEGQEFINAFLAGVQRLLREKGIEACAPGLDGRFEVFFEPVTTDGIADFHAESRWSERHAAYACGLGTFGLSRGLITEKGMAGRFGSVIAAEQWEASGRNYTGVYDYCTRCGACARNCPARAITLEHGKNNVLCNTHIKNMKAKYPPRYGCGKCQVGVPCEFRAPGLKKQ